jgi:hypothetical protein
MSDTSVVELFPLILGCLMVGVGVVACFWAARSRVQDVEAELESQRPLTRLLMSGSIETRWTARHTVFSRWLLGGAAIFLGIVLIGAGVSG